MAGESRKRFHVFLEPSELQKMKTLQEEQPDVTFALNLNPQWGPEDMDEVTRFVRAELLSPDVPPGGIKPIDPPRTT